MATQAPVAFASCSACGKKYKWKESCAGKTVPCPCGGQVVFSRSAAPGSLPPPPAIVPISSRIVAAPPTPPARPAPPRNVYDDAPSDPYALSAPQTPAPQPYMTNACPHCSAMMGPGAVLCMRCGYNTKTGKALSTKVKTGPGIGDVASAAGAVAGKTIAGLIVGGIAAVLCGLGWGFIGIATQYEIGYAAWGVGIITGGAMRIVNYQGGAAAAFAGALFAAVGLGIGKLILMNHFGPDVWSPLDALWFALALGTAFKVASGGTSDS